MSTISIVSLIALVAVLNTNKYLSNTDWFVANRSAIKSKDSKKQVSLEPADLDALAEELEIEIDSEAIFDQPHQFNHLASVLNSIGHKRITDWVATPDCSMLFSKSKPASKLVVTEDLLEKIAKSFEEKKDKENAEFVLGLSKYLFVPVQPTELTKEEPEKEISDAQAI